MQKYRREVDMNDIGFVQNCSATVTHSTSVNESTVQIKKNITEYKSFYTMFNNTLREIELDEVSYTVIKNIVLARTDYGIVYYLCFVQAQSTDQYKSIELRYYNETLNQHYKFTNLTYGKFPCKNIGINLSYVKKDNGKYNVKITNSIIEEKYKIDGYEKFEHIFDYDFEESELGFGLMSNSTYSFSENYTFFAVEEKSNGSGIDLTLDTRPIHYIDEDGSAIQLVTERCIKNPSAFDMNAKEINVDNTKLITEYNLKSARITLENNANSGCVTVGYADEVLPYAKYNHLKI